MLIGLAVRIAQAEIVLGVLIEILCRNAVAASLGFSREGGVALEYLMRVAADLNVGAIAVEGLGSLRRSLVLLVWPVAVIAARRARSCSHVA